MPIAIARRPRALVIDDNVSVCAALSELLWTIGYDTAVATSGTQALTLFDQRAFDLVTTDLRMPGMHGWQVVDAVRTRAPATQINEL